MQSYQSDEYGEIKYNPDEYGWQFQVTIRLFDRDYSLKVTFDVEGDAEGRDQIPVCMKAFKAFHSVAVDSVSTIESAFMRYYEEIRPEYSDRFSEESQHLVPVCKEHSDLAQVIKPEYVVVNTHRDEVELGLLCWCSWDESHGIVATFIDGKLVYVDVQDEFL